MTRSLRVLLVQAPSVEGPAAEIVAPLGLGMVAAAARAGGHDVELLDLNVQDDAQAALAGALSRTPEVVGVGLRNVDPLANKRHSYLPAFAAVLAAVRRLCPEAVLVVGGAGFSMFAAELMARYEAIDIGVALEGERTFPEVLARLGTRDAAGGVRGAAAAAGTPGTLVRVGGAVVDRGRRARLAQAELDVVRSWLPELVRDYAGRTSYTPAVGVETKRGCPLRCSYCVYPLLQGCRLRYRRPVTIVDEVELLVREAGVEWVHFTDPVLNFPAPHFRELCAALITRCLPVRWTGFFREDVLAPADAELAVRAGCAAFQFSGDGTCEATLARLGKGFGLDVLLASARAVAATEALTVYHFMANVPGTDQAVVAGARDLVGRLFDAHAKRGNLGAIVFNNLRVYPGTPLAAELTAAGWMPPGANLLYPTYYDPPPYTDLRYELEELAQLRGWRAAPVPLVDREKPRS